MENNTIENIREFTHSGTNIYVLFMDNSYLIIRTYPNIHYVDFTGGQSFKFMTKNTATDGYRFLLQLKHFNGWVETDEGDFVVVCRK